MRSSPTASGILPQCRIPYGLALSSYRACGAGFASSSWRLRLLRHRPHRGCHPRRRLLRRGRNGRQSRGRRRVALLCLLPNSLAASPRRRSAGCRPRSTCPSRGRPSRGALTSKITPQGNTGGTRIGIAWRKQPNPGKGAGGCGRDCESNVGDQGFSFGAPPSRVQLGHRK